MKVIDEAIEKNLFRGRLLSILKVNNRTYKSNNYYDNVIICFHFTFFIIEFA
jgi:hypothetical protein